MREVQTEKEYKDVKSNSLVFKAKREEHFNTKNTLSVLQRAIDTAESIDYPNRYNLLEIYFDIIKDAHLDSVVKHRKTRVKGLEYAVIKQNGTIDTKATQVFKEAWFSKFLNYTLDAIFYGNSLVEVFNNKGLDCVLIPRENVIPEFQEIKYWPSSQNGDIDYSAPIYSKRLVDINNANDNRNLGEYLSVSKLVLLKTEALLNWSQHVELFGQPIRIATTDTQDPVEHQAILKYLAELGRSGYLVKNSATEIEFQSDENKGDSSKMYLEFEKFVNEEISKKILGGTMITDSGSSRSQSEVHLKGSYLYTKEDIAFVERVINNQLLPVLRNMGIISAKGVMFKFREPEILTVDEKIKVDEFLLKHFDVKDITYFNERYGAELEYKENIVIDNVSNESND